MNGKTWAFIPDFLFFLILALAGEFIAVRALWYFSSGFYFSIAVLPLMILLFRWGLPALPALGIFGIGSALLLPGMGFITVLVNGAGYCALAASLVLLCSGGRERVKESPYWALLYMVTGYGGMVVSRAVILTLFEGNILSGLLLVGANESLSFITSTVLFVLMRSRQGLLVYLPRLIDERENDAPPGPWKPNNL